MPARLRIAVPPDSSEIHCNAASEVIADLVGELFEQRRLLADILNDFCTQTVVRPKPIEQRTAARLLSEIQDSLTTLAAMTNVKICTRTRRSRSR